MGTFSNSFTKLLSLSAVFTLLVSLTVITQKPQKVIISKGAGRVTVSTPTPTPFNPFPYKIPQIPVSRSYRTMLVGDSIIGVLGPNAQLLRQHLIELYPTHEFVNYNFGFGATNIETLPKRLTDEYEYKDTNYPSVLSQGFDLIVIGSFAYNPLSEDPNGLEKHIEILNESVWKIIAQKPDSVVAIMLPIAPSKDLFAKGIYDLSTQERQKWAEERIGYIKAVEAYAKEKNIPTINIYEKSLTPEGEASLEYINKDDYIHPSAKGVDLISKTIAEFIYDNKIFPE